MERSLRFVLIGTFTLRFSTGLTGSMLAFYLAHLSDHGGVAVDAKVVGLYAAIFYLTELLLSPVFGILSDRFGHHRVMLWGPIFGAVAVILTGLSTNLLVLGGTRMLEGASGAASIPSILGFIALATAGNEVMRGKTAARFEAATLAGLAGGAILGVKLFELVGPTAFFLNAALYGVSFLIYKFGVSDPAGDADAVKGEHVRASRYLALIRTSHVWLLAPTWIAVNAAIGVWLSQSVFQLAKGDPRFPEQVLMTGFSANQITVGAIAVAAVFGAGLLYWGNRFKNLRRTTIIGYGVLGGGVLVVAGLVVNHTGSVPIVMVAAGAAAAAGLFLLAGATPAALGLLADMSERFPSDRGAIMGLYSVFLALGQIIGSLIGGVAADWRGIDGMFIATFVLLVIAIVPLTRLRAQEHQLGEPRGRDERRVSVDRPWAPVPLVRGSHGAVVAPHHLATAAGLDILRAGGTAIDAAIATNAALGVVMPSGCGIGGDAFWLTWDAATGRQSALNGSGRAGSRADATFLRASGLSELPRRGPLSITVPGAVRSWGDAHRRGGRLSRDRILAPAIELARAGFPAWDGFIDAVERTAPLVAEQLGPDAGFFAVYRPHGRAWRPGEIVRLPALATTLETLALEGFDAFYDGDLGERQGRTLDDLGSFVTTADLRAHTSTPTEPIAIDYRGVRVTTHPPNSSGVVALELLSILARFEAPGASAFGAHGVTDPGWIHLGIEAAKLAMADRDAFVTDPDAETVPVDHLLDPAYAAELAARIDPSRASVPPAAANPNGGGTIYLATVDAEGNAVSLIESNYLGFGSGVVDPGTGIHYQNRGSYFSLDATTPQPPRAGQADAPHAAPRDAVP